MDNQELKGHESLISERGKVYGDPKESHEAIARLWSGWLRSRYGAALPLDAEDAAMMLHLMKCSRIGRALQQGSMHKDNWDDGEVYWGFAKEFEAGRSRLEDLVKQFSCANCERLNTALDAGKWRSFYAQPDET